ncbi:DUF2247 family protein [Bacillus amyloliquefaciens]|nr:DUF2247 family protein [Bacillus amyloliquefaciens]MEC3839459.1 DUF2247 family protein [Bacillus amyloliquefaciens]
MEGFINYLPPKNDYDPSLSSKEENTKRLVNEFQSFLENERECLLKE